MPDISMCSGGECKRKEQCYRFTASPNAYRQAYSNFETEHENCKYFSLDDRTELEKQLDEERYQKDCKVRQDYIDRNPGCNL